MALLLTKDPIPKTHSGVISLLHQHFVQNGSLDATHASFFTKLMQERINEDYSDVLTLEEEAEPFIEPTKAYIAYVDKIIAHSL